MTQPFTYKQSILSEHDIDIVKTYILESESYVKSLGPDNYSATSNDSLTGRYKYYNYLNSNIGGILKPKLIQIFGELNLKYPISVQCWANIFRKGEGIQLHHHSDRNYLSANIFISGNTKPGTTYHFEDPSNFGFFDVENVIGEICIFSSTLLHGVKPNTNSEIRISMALDIHENCDYSSVDSYYVFK
jgi:hypothetical protein